MRLLTFSTLYPNAQQPNHGIFVENRLRHLAGTPDVRATVVAPVPYFPSGARVFGDWARYARVPAREDRHGLTVHHPRFPVIPRFGMSIAPTLLYRASAAFLDRQVAAGLTFDAIDAHYLYPDGVAAVRLARRYGVPVVLTARGSDVTQLPDYPAPRAAIVDALGRADALVTVSSALRDGLIALGASRERVSVLRNGIDTEMFRPVDRASARAALGVSGPTLLSVGHLIERKRHHLTIAAMRDLPDCTQLIAGEGPERERLTALIARLGLGGRVRLLGARPHAALPHLYGAADVMVLASSREGWANVLLEAMACGTPVLAYAIGGNAEVVRTPAAGQIVAPETPEAIADGVRRILAAPPRREATRAYAEAHGWGETTAGQVRLFRSVIAAWSERGSARRAA